VVTGLSPISLLLLRVKYLSTLVYTARLVWGKAGLLAALAASPSMARPGGELGASAGRRAGRRAAPVSGRGQAGERARAAAAPADGARPCSP